MQNKLCRLTGDCFFKIKERSMKFSQLYKLSLCKLSLHSLSVTKKKKKSNCCKIHTEKDILKLFDLQLCPRKFIQTFMAKFFN